MQEHNTFIKNIGLFICLFITCCAFGLTQNNAHFVLYLFIPIAVYYTSKYRYVDGVFKKPLLIFFLLLVASSISCLFFRHQHIKDTFTTKYYLNFYCLSAYFMLLYKRVGIDLVEKVLHILFIVFIVIYSIQYVIFPKTIVQILVQNDNEHRIRLFGQIIALYGTFRSYNNYLINRTTKSLILTVIGILIIITYGFRTMIAALALTMLVMYSKYNRISIMSAVKVIIGASLLFFALLKIPAVSQSIDRMIQVQSEGQNYSNEDYVRLIQLDYYMNDHFVSDYERIFGSGIPSHKSTYGKSMMIDKDNYKVDFIKGWVDWGMIGLTWIIGPFAVLCLIYMFAKSMIISWKSDPHYFHIFGFFMFLLLVSINNVEAYRIGCCGVEACALYIISCVQKNRTYD